MERKIEKFLMHWKEDVNRKPLVIYGSKQVGKSYTAIKFGQNNFDNTVYIDASIASFCTDIKKEKTITSIIKFLEEYSSSIILKDKTLVILDNVNDVEVVNTIKTFGKFKNDYHIILITSFRDNLSKFKGVELQFKSLFPMDFEEYLTALGKIELIDFIKASFKNNSEMPFHSLAIEYFNNFIFTGGMPEAVNISINSDNILYLNSVFDKILDIYHKEISFQDNLIDIVRCRESFDSIPMQLSKSNKKFQYGLIKDGARSKEYENSLSFLHNNGFIYKCYKLLDVKSPLSANKDKDCFRVYMNDTGLLCKKLYINKNNFEEMKSILYENSVAISLASLGYSLQYYQSMGKAEIDFVIQTKTSTIVPIEIVPHNKTKSKALSLFMNNYNSMYGIRITSDNFSVRGNIRYIPIYAVFCFGSLM